MNVQLPGSSGRDHRLDNSADRADIPFEELVDGSPLAVSVLLDGRWVFANSAVDRLLGLALGDAVGRDPREFVHLNSVLNVERWMRSSAAPSPRPFQTTVVRADGSIVQVESVAQRVRLGERDGIGVISRDITAQVQRETQLAHAATHDALTGLVNRTLLLDRLEQSVARIGRGSAGLIVMFLDLDGFKTINDTHGHSAGDQVLRQVALRLRASLRTSDTIARLAGDEFVIAADATGPGSAEYQVRTMRNRVEHSLDKPIPVDGGYLHVEASIGSLLVNADWDPVRMIAEADRLMYLHKQHRRRIRRIPGARGAV